MNKTGISERFIQFPNLPTAPVTLAVLSGRSPEIIDKIKTMGIEPIITQPSDWLSTPVSDHADLQCLPLGRTNVLVSQTEHYLQSKLQEHGFHIEITQQKTGKQYPQDVLLNACIVQELMFGKFESWDLKLQEFAKKQKKKIAAVNQGYTNCSVAIISDKAMITADQGIAAAAKQHKLDVLEIRPGFIKLPGYDTGFIGGCCGLLSEDCIGFTGGLHTHPDGDLIKRFIEFHHKKIIELSEGDLLDIGGIIPLKEKDESKI